MATKQFNLSVLDNVTTLSTPLKQSFDYESIFSLIKEEIDIAQTEDEMEYRKVEKITNNKHREPCSSESLFKSPLKKKMCFKLKNSCLSAGACKQKFVEFQKNEARAKRVGLVGRVKPGRTFGADHRKRKISTSYSDTSGFSDYGDGAAAETPKKMFKSRIQMVNVAKGVVQKHIVDSPNADADPSNACIKKERTYPENADSPDAEELDGSFVESSQGTVASSELRRSLNHRRATAKIDRDEQPNDKVKYEAEEEDYQQFLLPISPDCKLTTSTNNKEPTTSPLWARKKKAVCRVSPLKGSTLENTNSIDKISTDASLPRQRHQKNSSSNPFRGLTQELDDVINADDYVEMCDSDTETTSFTFETIQLLNEYDDSNRKANNKMLDKIFSSPIGTSLETPPRSDTGGSIEDPLWIDEPNEPISFKSKRNVATSKMTKSSMKKCNRAIRRHVDNVIPAKSKGHLNTTETIMGSNEKSTALPTMTNTDDSRRYSARLKNKTPINANITDEESKDILSAKAAKLVEKVFNAKIKMTLPTDTVQQLQKLVVRLRHKVLPQHEIENSAGSSALSYTQQKQFLEYATLNKNTYSPAEDKIIKENWNHFCQDHDWDPHYHEPFVLLKHGEELIMSSLEERRKFVQFLANGLPNRPLCSVYNRFRLLYNKRKAAGSRYTKKEDEAIIAYMKYHPDEPREHKYSELARVMNRSRTSIWKRYTKLVDRNCSMKKINKKVLTKVEWNLPLVEEFVTTLLDVTLSDELIDLKDAFLPRVIWRKVQEKMKIHYDVMQRFWERQLHLQLFAPEPIFINEIKIKLIECMHMKNISHTKEIKWDAILKFFDGYTIPFLRYVFNHLTSTAAATLQTRDLCEILEWLHTKKLETLRLAARDRFLPRICYVDKKAELVAEDLARETLVSENSDVE